MNEIFYPKHVKDAGDTDPPIYIAVCPDLKACRKFVSLPPAEVTSIERMGVQVFAGYYEEDWVEIHADGPMNNIPAKPLPPSHEYETLTGVHVGWNAAKEKIANQQSDLLFVQPTCHSSLRLTLKCISSFWRIHWSKKQK